MENHHGKHLSICPKIRKSFKFIISYYIILHIILYIILTSKRHGKDHGTSYLGLSPNPWVSTLFWRIKRLGQNPPPQPVPSFRRTMRSTTWEHDPRPLMMKFTEFPLSLLITRKGNQMIYIRGSQRPP